MRPITAIGMVALVAGPWFWAVTMKTNGEFLREFIGVHHVQRFNIPTEGHEGGPYYYFVSVVAGMFPWSVFVVPGLFILNRLRRRRVKEFGGVVFAACWAGVYVGLFSLAGTKLPNYVLPAYPALALLAAVAYTHWIDHPRCVYRIWPRVAFGIIILAGFGLVGGLPAAGFVRVNGRSLLDLVGLARDVQLDVVWLGLVGVPATFGGLISLILAERGHIRQAVWSLAGTATISVLLLWNFAAPLVDRYQVSEPIARAIKQRCGKQEPKIAHYGFFQPSLVFYAQRPITSCPDADHARQFLEASDSHFLITTGERLTELQAALPADIEILKRRNCFPKKGEVLLLAKAHGRPKQPLALAQPSQALRR